MVRRRSGSRLSSTRVGRTGTEVVAHSLVHTQLLTSLPDGPARTNRSPDGSTATVPDAESSTCG